ncbi:hypothetical protein GUJ93_ZPchr0012g19163 [Zizania palustris]|uniref:Uncharacterized protein n=1 Tax=Zizania palustris TaxID=103762 RepID=A0A8J5WTG9_ZIZPA|nr:hypothetical protein GUJ93_ZPchr0012g19163 [Zizania palustris]
MVQEGSKASVWIGSDLGFKYQKTNRSRSNSKGYLSLDKAGRFLDEQATAAAVVVLGSVDFGVLQLQQWLEPQLGQQEYKPRAERPGLC